MYWQGTSLTRTLGLHDVQDSDRDRVACVVTSSEMLCATSHINMSRGGSLYLGLSTSLNTMRSQTVFDQSLYVLMWGVEAVLRRSV